MCSYIIILKVNTFNNWLPFCLTATTISFDQPTYSVNEADGKVEPVLVLSNSSSSVVTVQVFNINETALGKQLSISCTIIE